MEPVLTNWVGVAQGPSQGVDGAWTLAETVRSPLRVEEGPATEPRSL